jgi:hypothetical protein
MPDRSPPKPKTNLGKPLSNSAVRGLMRAMLSVKTPPGRAARFDAAVADRGPVRSFTPEQMLQLAARIPDGALKIVATGVKKDEAA